MLYDNAIILTMNPQRQVLRHGAVVVDGDRFEAVRPAASSASATPPNPSLT